MLFSCEPKCQIIIIIIITTIIFVTFIIHGTGDFSNKTFRPRYTTFRGVHWMFITNTN